MEKNKIAFMTMDIESLFDANCLKGKSVKYIDEYSLEEETKRYIDLLDSYNIKATFFLLTTSIPKVKDFLIDAINNKHELALHGLNHISPIEGTIDTFKNDIIEAKKIIKNEFNYDVKGYRAPCFGITNDHLEILNELGFTYDSSCIDFKKAEASGYIDLSNFNKISDSIYDSNGFKEISLSKATIGKKNLPISGGAYVRLIPWFIIRHNIKKYLKTHDTYVFYLHPFEISRKRPHHFKGVKLSKNLYFNVHRIRYFKKIKKIIGYLKKYNYTFKTMNEI